MKMTPYECIAMSLLDHPNIIRYYHAWTEDNISHVDEKFMSQLTSCGNNRPTKTLFIAMECCVETLRGRLSRTISSDELDRIFEDILKGLRYMHGRKIIHCDISPDNIFLDSSGTCKIGDFGVAAILEEGKSNLKDRLREGTVAYFAPEVCKRGMYSPASDIYAVGLSIMDALYPSGTSMEKEAFFKELKVQRFPERDPRLSQITYEYIQAMLNPNAADRPSATGLLHEIESRDALC